MPKLTSNQRAAILKQNEEKTKQLEKDVKEYCKGKKGKNNG